MKVRAYVEDSEELIQHEVMQAYRVSGDLVEFLPASDVPGMRYRIIFNGTATRNWTPRRPSARVAVFFAEKIKNDRYVIAE